MKKTQVVTLLAITLTAIITDLIPVHAAPDFTISANPTRSYALYAGLPNNDTITVTNTGGFTGAVTFSGTATNGIALAFNPGSVTLSSGGQATSTLAITPGANCNVGRGHTIVATGTSGP